MEELIVVWDEVGKQWVVDVVLSEEGLADLTDAPEFADVTHVKYQGDDIFQNSPSEPARWCAIIADSTGNFWETL